MFLKIIVFVSINLVFLKIIVFINLVFLKIIVFSEY